MQLQMCPYAISINFLIYFQKYRNPFQRYRRIIEKEIGNSRISIILNIYLINIIIFRYHLN